MGEAEAADGKEDEAEGVEMVDEVEGGEDLHRLFRSASQRVPSLPDLLLARRRSLIREPDAYMS